MKSLGVYHRYVKMPWGGCVHGLEYFTFYVQKQLAHFTACSGSPLFHDGSLGGTRICETCLLNVFLKLFVDPMKKYA